MGDHTILTGIRPILEMLASLKFNLGPKLTQKDLKTSFDFVQFKSAIKITLVKKTKNRSKRSPNQLQN